MSAGPLLIALALDAALGEPHWLWSRAPHPAVMMGRCIGWAEARFNRGTSRRLKGTLVMLGLVAAMWALGTGLGVLGEWAAIVIAAILIAQRSLIDHVQAVAEALRSSLAEGRASVAMIVGRDTAGMDKSAVARSAIESAAENLSDGVVAPAFWFLVGGLPGILIYKMTNTADSMIGYRTPRYEAFGWAAARFDDLLNLIPARLTALMIGAVYRLGTQAGAIAAEARLHRSPNAGWPEAAMARALGVALSGPRSYDGALKTFPFVNAAGRTALNAHDIEAACRALWVTWGALMAIVFVLWCAGF